jgi:hypothetical protein
VGQGHGRGSADDLHGHDMQRTASRYMKRPKSLLPVATGFARPGGEGPLISSGDLNCNV